MAPKPPAAKRRRTDIQQNAEKNFEAITHLRALQSALADYSGAGLKSVKDFLNRCSKGPEVEETEATANRAILKEYLEAATRNASKEDDGEAESSSTAFADVVQIWSYANQNNAMSALSMVPTTMTILVRLCSYHEEFKAYGITLIRTLLRPATLKIIYRGLTGNKDHIVSPCLRLLTEMNRFNFGAMCGVVHSAFDFTVKDLPRNLEVKGLTKPVVEDPARPSVRTVYLRFFLSFLQNGEPSVRNEVLGLRSWITPIFKHLKTDSAEAIRDFLECMTTRVLDEKEIPRATKTNFFNEWTLSHVLGLYTREETVKVSKAGKEEEKRLADIAHEFLLNACTKRGAGICFPDHGWYPPGHSDGEEKKKNAPKVHNRILSSLLTSIRPYADTMQLDLALGICKTCPELVADHFLSNPAFSFEPKLTSTWIGYSTFLSSIITLPIPENFGAPTPSALPPPTHVVVENVLPKPLNKTVLTKCLTHENGLIKFLTTRLLVTAFQKLRSVLDALDAGAAAVHDPTESWKKCRFDVVEEFCRRIPDASVVSSIGSGKSDTQSLLQIEAKTRLLADYYTTIPEMASSGRFDVNVTLGNFLENEDDDQKGMRLLEMGHLLKIANEVPDVKWWNKTPAMKHSPFVAILKRCCNSAINAPQRQVLALLHSFASSSYLFQSETSASPLDALLESLSAVGKSEDLDAILKFLDEVVARCIRGPFKYLDDYAEIATEVQKQTPESSQLPPVSPIVMALVEQWKFFMQSKDYSSQQKLGGLSWLLRFLESCAILGENRFVLAVLCDRVLAGSGDIKEGIQQLKDYLLGDRGLELTSDDAMEEDLAVRVRNLLTGLPERCVNVQIVPQLVDAVRHRSIETTVFDLVVVQRAITEVVKCRATNSADAIAAITKLTELMKYMAFQLASQGDKNIEKTKAFLAKESPCLQMFLSTSFPTGKLPEVVALSHGYAELLSVVFKKGDPVLESSRQRLCDRTDQFTSTLSALSHDDLPKILFVYRTVITLLYNSEDVNRLVKQLSNESSLGSDGVLSQLVAFILHISAERGDVIDAAFIDRLLQADSMTSRVSSALVAYISAADSDYLHGIAYPKAAQAEQLAVVCALIPKLQGIRDVALNAVDKSLSAGPVLMLSERISALLEAYSVEDEDSTGFTWSSSADESVKSKLQRVFNVAQTVMLESAADASQVNVLRRAASLFPSLDRGQALQHVAKNRKRSVMSENTVALIDALVEDSDDAATPEMRSWFLMAFDHLTRRFAEDAVLAPKVTAFAKALGKFLARREITIDKLVPRTTLNAVLEAGLQKHITVPEVVFFAVNVATLASPKSLDLAKLLQMVLGHAENPLAFRGTVYEPEAIHHYLAFLILKLFRAGKTALCNITTLDGVMALYRGTNDFIDGLLLKIITQVEGHLARSCASRVAAWSVVESTDKPLITRVRGRLEVTINAKMLSKSIFHFVPSDPPSSDDFETLSSYLATIKNTTLPVGKAYDPRFLLPAITYCLISTTTHMLEPQAAIERHCLSFTLSCLSSSSTSTRAMATGFLNALASKLEESAYRGKTQLNHLILGVLASLSSEPLPAVMSIFLAQAAQVLANPTHFLYEKVMELLLRNPLLQLHDIPIMLSTAHIDGDENHHKEIAWILNILAAGIKTQQDLMLYRKRNVFGNVLAVYNSPNSTERAKEKVLELLWNAAAVEGGGTTLITRNGVVAWIEQQLGFSEDEMEAVTLRRLLARMWEASAKTHVKEWSRGNLGGHFVKVAV